MTKQIQLNKKYILTYIHRAYNSTGYYEHVIEVAKTGTYERAMINVINKKKKPDPTIFADEAADLKKYIQKIVREAKKEREEEIIEIIADTKVTTGNPERDFALTVTLDHLINKIKQ
jgi:hypothetical protein